MRVNVIEKVREYIEKARELVPNVTNDMLDSDGAIYYMNGNDGTDFDWNANDRLCEFMVFGKDGMGFIKVFVKKNDVMSGYIYEDCGMHPTHTLDAEELNEGEARELACQMFQITDRKGIWDAKIDTLDFNAEVFDLLDDDEEYEEEYDDDEDEDEDEGW